MRGVEGDGGGGSDMAAGNFHFHLPFLFCLFFLGGEGGIVELQPSFQVCHTHE